MRLTVFPAMLPALFSVITATPVLADADENPWFEKMVTAKSEGANTRRVSRLHALRPGHLRRRIYISVSMWILHHNNLLQPP